MEDKVRYTCGSDAPLDSGFIDGFSLTLVIKILARLTNVDLQNIFRLDAILTLVTVA